MRHISRPAAAVSTIVLSALCYLIVPSGANADAAPVVGTKAGIEHAERLAAGEPVPSTKAQIEHHERASSLVDSPAREAPVGVPAPSNNSVAAWQLAFSAALGAALTGGVLLAARQVNHHRQAVAA
jgi:hypothetical protein